MLKISQSFCFFEMTATMVIKSFRIDTEHKIEESLRTIAKQSAHVAASLALLAMTILSCRSL